MKHYLKFAIKNLLTLLVMSLLPLACSEDIEGLNDEVSSRLDNPDNVIVNSIPVDGCPTGYIWDNAAGKCIPAAQPSINLQTWRSILSNDLNQRFNSTDKYLVRLNSYNYYYYNG